MTQAHNQQTHIDIDKKPVPIGQKYLPLRNGMSNIKKRPDQVFLVPDKKELQDKLQQWIQEFDKEEDL